MLVIQHHIDKYPNSKISKHMVYLMLAICFNVLGMETNPTLSKPYTCIESSCQTRCLSLQKLRYHLTAKHQSVLAHPDFSQRYPMIAEDLRQCNKCERYHFGNSHKRYCVAHRWPLPESEFNKLSANKQNKYLLKAAKKGLLGAPIETGAYHNIYDAKFGKVYVCFAFDHASLNLSAHNSHRFSRHQSERPHYGTHSLEAMPIQYILN